MQDYLNEHFGSLISNRADKSWTPTLHAREDVATAYPTIAGIAVTVDPYVDPITIEMRAHTGKLMASYTGVRLP